jgi:hypothetical protein
MILFGFPRRSMTETDLDTLSNRHGLVLHVKLINDSFFRQSPVFGQRQHAGSQEGLFIGPAFL